MLKCNGKCGKAVLAERIYLTCKRVPERKACCIGEDEMTFRELWYCAVKTAEKLRTMGGTAPVLLMSGHSMKEIIAVVACILSERTYVPISAFLPKKRLESIIRMTGASLLLTDGHGLYGETDGMPLNVLQLDEIAVGKEDIPFEDIERCFENVPFHNAKYGFEASHGCDSASFVEECAAGNVSARETSDNEIAYMIFTSGSTGEPKGVPISYENLNHFIDWVGTLSPMDGYEGATVLNQASLGFDLSVADLYYCLCYGHTWVAFPEGFPGADGELTECFRRRRIQVAVMTPSAMKMCLLDENFTKETLPDFRCVYFCGERLEKKTVRKLWAHFPGLAIINAYGPTEATSAVCGVRITEEMLADGEELPVGAIASAATEISITDGEIVLRGPSVFGGYAGVREEERTVPGADGYHTGDCGFFRDGLLYYRGRMDSQVKYKGYRIELYDIENNLNRLPEVHESAVVAVRDANGAVKTIQAYVVTEDEQNGAEFVKTELRKLLPEYMIPKTIKKVSALPVNANGKLDRKALETK